MSPRLDIVLDGLPLDEKPPGYTGILGGTNFNGEEQTPSSPGMGEWCVDLLRPAIFTRSGPRGKLRPTAYLDGLRGFAAFLVYWHHHQLWPRTSIFADQNFENGWGYQGRYFFACFPGIRMFFSGGHFAVAVFFIISGYVLSTKPLSLIQSKQHDKLAENLASALFRRWIRLFLPVAVTVWLYFTCWHLFGIWTVSPKHEGKYKDELWNFYMEFKAYSFVFRTGGDGWLTYNFHVWSIPVEFKGSIAIYTCLMALSRCTKNMRLAISAGLVWYFMYVVDGWFASMFCMGMLLCDLDMLAAKNKLPAFFSRFEPYKQPIYIVLFVFGIFLGGIPSHMGGDINSVKETPGWYYLGHLQPQAAFDYKWFYLFFAATFIVSSVPRVRPLKSFFETRFCQHLGRISYSLYLLHGPILWIVGDRLYSATGWYREVNEAHTPYWINRLPLSKSGPLGFDMAFLVPQLILFPLTFWAAEMGTKLIDEPSVRFSQWLYKQAIEPPSDERPQRT